MTLKNYKISHINELDFSQELHWPVVYILSNPKSKKIYIGETTNVTNRFKEHDKDQEKRDLFDRYIINHSKANKSLTYFLESFLIARAIEDSNVTEVNKRPQNSELKRERNFYKREAIQDESPFIWDDLRDIGIFNNTVGEIESSRSFLNNSMNIINEEQNYFINEIIKSINNRENTIINGGAGTGKTVIIREIIQRYFYQKENNPDINIGVYTAAKNNYLQLRDELKKMSPRITERIKIIEKLNIKNLSSVDHIIIDEAHRLRSKSKNNNLYGGTKDFIKSNDNREIDFILNKLSNASKRKSFTIVYDAFQRIDFRDFDFDKWICENNFKYNEINLENQFRINGCVNFNKFIYDLLGLKKDSGEKFDFSNFEIKVVDTEAEGLGWIESKNQENIRTGIVSCESKSRDDWSNSFIKVSDKLLNYNNDRSSERDWVNKSTLNDIGSGHRVQGKDLDYEFLIIGSGIDYDGKIVIDTSKYKDNKYQGLTEEEKKNLIMNNYNVLMTRARNGMAIYCKNEGFRRYLKDFIKDRVFNN